MSEVKEVAKRYLTKEGEIPFWDWPNVVGYRILPKQYRPITTLDGMLTLVNRNMISELDMKIMKVIGDAHCANEDQIRRYLAINGESRSKVSNRLDRFRETGIVERYKIRLLEDENEEFKPPAPFVLGVAGYNLINHYYNQQRYIRPNEWDMLGTDGIQRYVAMNEIRCLLAEKRVLKGWVWNGIVGYDRLLPKPFAAGHVMTNKGMLKWLIERPQQSKKFIPYLRSKLETWASIYEQNNDIPVYSLGKYPPVVLVYTSTLEMAEHIHKEIVLDRFPYPVWLCVEEELKEFSTAFFVPNGEKLQRIRLDFLN